MGEPTPDQITELLLEWRGGSQEALDRLLPLVYEDLRRQARECMRGERGDHTLQTTALVHEAYLRLVRSDVPWEDRVHFFAVAARAMRRILVDHARSHRSAKRGEGQAPLPLDEALAVEAEPSRGILALDLALDQLQQLDARKSQVIELFFFGGLTYDEIASTLEISPATVHREMRLARAWVRREMVRTGSGRDEGEAGPGR